MNKLSLLVLAAASAGLAGCVSLVPKSDPVQLYRLSPPAAAQAAPAPEVARIDVALLPLEFPRAAATDRILTYTGPEAAYIADARWVAPAQVLFAEALEGAFGGQGGTVRLLAGRGENNGAGLLLDLDVREFETRYDAGGDAAPTVVVGVNAKLVRLPDRKVVGERTFRVSQPAAENRVRAIVPAYQTAMDQALGELVAWTDAAARADGATAQR